MPANEDVDVGAGELIRQHQHVLVPKGVDVAAAKTALVGIDVRAEGPVLEAHCAHPEAHYPGDEEAEYPNQHRMTNFHDWRPCPPAGGVYPAGSKTRLRAWAL